MAPHALDSWDDIGLIERWVVRSRKHTEQPVSLVHIGPRTVVARLEEAGGSGLVVVANQLDGIWHIEIDDIVSSVVSAKADPHRFGPGRSIGVPAWVALQARAGHTVADLEAGFVTFV